MRHNQSPSAKAAQKTLKEEAEKPKNTQFPIVGVGASAGGLEAFNHVEQSLLEDAV